MGGNAGDSTRVRRGSPCGGEDDEDDEDSRMDGAETFPRSPSEEAVRAEARWCGDTEPYASSSSAVLFNSGFSLNSRDNLTRRHRKKNWKELPGKHLPGSSFQFFLRCLLVGLFLLIGEKLLLNKAALLEEA